MLAVGAQAWCVSLCVFRFCGIGDKVFDLKSYYGENWIEVVSC